MRHQATLNILLSQVGECLRTLRRKRRFTQESSAEILGITSKHLGEVERGIAAPSLDLLCRLADLYGTSPSALLAMEPSDGRRQLVKKISALTEDADEDVLQIILKICSALVL